jgi:hypothetical protein
MCVSVNVNECVFYEGECICGKLRGEASTPHLWYYTSNPQRNLGLSRQLGYDTVYLGWCFQRNVLLLFECERRRRLHLPATRNHLRNSFSRVLRQFHSTFQKEFSTECNLMLPISISSILLLPEVHSVAAYFFFLVFTSFLRSFPQCVVEASPTARCPSPVSLPLFLLYVGYFSTASVV